MSRSLPIVLGEKSWLVRIGRPGLVAAVLVLAIALPYLVPVFRLSQVTSGLVLAIAVVGLNLLSGFGGQISLGHAAFFGLGAYGAGVLVVTIRDVAVGGDAGSGAHVPHRRWFARASGSSGPWDVPGSGDPVGRDHLPQSGAPLRVLDGGVVRTVRNRLPGPSNNVLRGPRRSDRMDVLGGARSPRSSRCSSCGP